MIEVTIKFAGVGLATLPSSSLGPLVDPHRLPLYLLDHLAEICGYGRLGSYNGISWAISMSTRPTQLATHLFCLPLCRL